MAEETKKVEETKKDNITKVKVKKPEDNITRVNIDKPLAEEKKQEQTQHDIAAPRLAQQGLVATVQMDNRDTIKPTSTSF